MELFSAAQTSNQQSAGLPHEWRRGLVFKVSGGGEGDLRGRWWQMEEWSVGSLPGGV